MKRWSEFFAVLKVELTSLCSTFRCGWHLYNFRFLLNVKIVHIGSTHIILSYHSAFFYLLGCVPFWRFLLFGVLEVITLKRFCSSRIYIQFSKTCSSLFTIFLLLVVLCLKSISGVSTYSFVIMVLLFSLFLNKIYSQFWCLLACSRYFLVKVVLISWLRSLRCVI